MIDPIRRIFGLPPKAESRALARAEKRARQERDIRRSCRHYCVSCEYFSRVYDIASSERLMADSAEMKARHVYACTSGAPEASSCVRFIARS